MIALLHLSNLRLFVQVPAVLFLALDSLEVLIFLCVMFYALEMFEGDI